MKVYNQSMKKYWIFSTLLFVSILFNGCSAETPAPTPDLDVLATRAVQTYSAQLTQTELAKPTLTPSPRSTSTSTATPSFTSTSAVTLPVENLGVEDKAVLVSQSPIDYAELGVKQKFDIIFTIRNDGQTTWTRNFKMRYFSGWEIAETKEVFFPNEVKPGEEVSLILDAIAPPYIGSYVTNWKVTNSEGQNFYDLYLNITVVAGNTSTPTETATATPE